MSVFSNYVSTSAYGNYYNWNWQNNNQNTTIDHRQFVRGHDDGHLGYDTQHWHEGEDAGLLYATVGVHSSYTDGPGP